MTAGPVSGRCLCGAIRYAYEGDVNWAGHCHCETCRRQCAAPVTSFFGVDNDRFRWTAGRPAAYASSEGVERLFCGVCGAPMAYRSAQFDHEIHLYAATLDDPSAFEPTAHFFHGERLSWLHLSDDLKKNEVGGL
ncbi:MAG: GFA family protein [Pseudomonadota bacterium]